MGHYRSEMGYEEKDAAREAFAAVMKKEGVDKIKKMIKKEGLESVLYDIIRGKIIL